MYEVYWKKWIARDKDEPPIITHEVHWPFYNGIFATIFAALATVSAVERVRVIGTAEQGYQDIGKGDLEARQ